MKLFSSSLSDLDSDVLARRLFADRHAADGGFGIAHVASVLAGLSTGEQKRNRKRNRKHAAKQAVTDEDEQQRTE